MSWPCPKQLYRGELVSPTQSVRSAVAEPPSPSVKNTFVDVASFLFDKEFVTDPRKCKSLPSLHSETNLVSSFKEENADTNFKLQADAVDLQDGLGAKTRDSSCRTADPMEDDQFCNFYLPPADLCTPVVPKQTLEQFLEPGVPAIPFANSYCVGRVGGSVGAQSQRSIQGTCPWKAPGYRRTSDEPRTSMSSPVSVASARLNDRCPSRKKLAAARGSRQFAPPKDSGAGWTCRMLRNIPNDYSRSDLVGMLDAKNIQYDFAYLPIDWGKGANLGYAFVHLVSSEEAERLEHVFSGFSAWTVASDKVCEVAWAKAEQQSLQLIVESFRNNPVMHPDVPEWFKPLLFDSLKNRIAFPAPTKALRPPRGFLRGRLDSQDSNLSASPCGTG